MATLVAYIILGIILGFIGLFVLAGALMFLGVVGFVVVAPFVWVHNLLKSV